MKNVIILGASGNIAKHVTDILLAKDDITLALFLRNKTGKRNNDISKCRVIGGDVSNIDQLKKSEKGQDIVYVNLSGGLETMAKNIVNAMNETKVKRIIAISSISTGGDGMLH
ncbi:MAG: NAD(P)H-binding protein [Chitinophagaceae bacterium]